MVPYLATKRDNGIVVVRNLIGRPKVIATMKRDGAQDETKSDVRQFC